MRKCYVLVIMAILLCTLSACQTTPNENVASNCYVLSDEQIIDRTLYLFDGYVLPVYWWRGAGNYVLDVYEWEDIAPLAGTPEGTTFYQVMRFHSIEEMKRATEQVVTREYAETYLYPYLEINKQFLEVDGKLYMNTAAGIGGIPFAPVSATVVSKTEREAVLAVVFRGPYEEEVTNEIKLVLENGIWKLNNTTFLDNYTGY